MTYRFVSCLAKYALVSLAMANRQMIVSKRPFKTVHYLDKNEIKAKQKSSPSPSGRSTPPTRRGAGHTGGIKVTPNLSPVASSGTGSIASDRRSVKADMKQGAVEVVPNEYSSGNPKEIKAKAGIR